MIGGGRGVCPFDIRVECDGEGSGRVGEGVGEVAPVGDDPEDATQFFPLLLRSALYLRMDADRSSLRTVHRLID